MSALARGVFPLFTSFSIPAQRWDAVAAFDLASGDFPDLVATAWSATQQGWMEAPPPRAAAVPVAPSAPAAPASAAAAGAAASAAAGS